MSGTPAGGMTPALADAVIEEVLLACGGGTLAVVGQGAAHCVRAALRIGIDARGVEVSDAGAVEWARTAMPGRVVAGSVCALPYADGAVDTLVVLHGLETLDEDDVPTAIAEIGRVASRAVYLRMATSPASGADGVFRSRGGWEQPLFSAGFRKHPSYYRVNAYEALEGEAGEITIVLEKLPAPALKRYPLAALAEERDLHMDMLRETGARSDAHVARYQWAAAFVRPGDTVLDAACGLGYGSYFLQTGTEAACTLGIDGSAYAIDYARENFSAIVPGLEFREGFLPGALASIPDHSVDVVVSFETLEHVDDNLALLAEFHRVLTPAGRIVVSVPNDWSDETGEDPNPFHVHVYTLERLRRELGAHFILEKLVAQSASQHKSGPDRTAWTAAGRSLRDVSPDVADDQAPDAEWWLAVAMRSPLEGQDVPYRETQFPQFPSPDWNVTAFGRDYRNPWLVRGMVDIAHRLQAPGALHVLAEEVAATAALDTADAGAALCVLAYQMLDAPETTCAAVEALDRRVMVYLDEDPPSPHGQRWCVSLQFVLGRLWMGVGDFARAAESLEGCIARGSDRFSPLLDNRVVEACLILGQLNLHQGHRDSALRWWSTGIERARRAVGGDWSGAIGDLAHPAEFGLPELASILEYASACAYALVHVDDVDVKPWWWLHPRRDRLSRHAAVLRELVCQREQLAVRDRELAAYRAQSDAYREQLSRAVDAARDTAAYSERLAGELGSYQGQSDAYRQQLDAAQTTTRELSGYAERLVRELAALKAESEEYARSVRKAQADVIDATASRAEVERALSESRNVAATLERRQAEAEARLSAADRLVAGLQGEVAAYARESASYAEQIQAAEARLQESAAYASTLLSQIEAYQRQSVEYCEQIRGAETQLQAASEHIASLQDQVVAYERQASQHAEQSRAAEARLQEGAAYASTLLSQIEAYQRQSVEYCEQIRGAETQLQAASEHTASLLEHVAACAGESQAYRTQLDEAVSRLSEFDAYVRRLEAELTAYQTQADVHEKRLAAVQQDADSAAASVRNLERDAVRMRDQLDREARRLGVSEATRTALERSLADAEGRVATFIEQEMVHRSRIGALESQVECLEQERNAHQVQYRSMLTLYSSRMASPRFLLRRLWHLILVRVGLIRRRESEEQ